MNSGDWVEVHSVFDGELQRVRRIKRLTSGVSDLELRGSVSAVDIMAQSFRMLGVDIFVEGAEAIALLERLTEGDRVSLSGRFSAAAPAGLVAERIRQIPDLPQLPVCVPSLPECPKPGPAVDN